MKRIYTSLLMALSLQCLTACQPSASVINQKNIKASQVYVTKEIKLPPFNHLRLTGSPHVIYTQKAGTPRATIHTSDNIVDLLEVAVKNQTLHIGFKKNVQVRYDKLTIHVSSETLHKAMVTGSGEIEFAHGLETTNLSLGVTGSGNIEGTNLTCSDLNAEVTGSGNISLTHLKAESTQAKITGSGDIHLQGKTHAATYAVTGSGDLNAEELITPQASSEVTGSGNIKCHATEQLKTRITGSGKIGYQGNPQIDNGKKNVYRL